MTSLAGVTVGLLERRHPVGHAGSLVDKLLPALKRRGALLRLIHAEEGVHRLDQRPPWDVTLLKSGTSAALHLAAAASAFGIPAINDPEATRLAQDRLAAVAILTGAGLPVPPARLAWLGGDPIATESALDIRRPVLVKAARGSQGNGLWAVEPGRFAQLARTLPPGPYLIMDRLPRAGDDLKVFVAGSWLRAIRRPFPATSLTQKRGRPAALPPEVAAAARTAGSALGLRCYGCDFIESPDGWQLVDVNAFPGYKGADGAADAIAAELVRTLREPGD